MRFPGAAGSAMSPMYFNGIRGGGGGSTGPVATGGGSGVVVTAGFGGGGGGFGLNRNGFRSVV